MQKPWLIFIQFSLISSEARPGANKFRVHLFVFLHFSTNIPHPLCTLLLFVIMSQKSWNDIACTEMFSFGSVLINKNWDQRLCTMYEHIDTMSIPIFMVLLSLIYLIQNNLYMPYAIRYTAQVQLERLGTM